MNGSLPCRGAAALLLPLFLSLPAAAQSGTAAGPHTAAAFQDWKEAHGHDWILRGDVRTGGAAFLWGGGAQAAFEPRSDAEYEEAARMFFDEAWEMFRLDDETLVLDRVVRLPLSQAGTTDKVAVTFKEAVAGVPVVGGSASALFGPGGVLLALDSTGLPGLAGFDLRPRFSRWSAVRRAGREFTRRTGWPAESYGNPELVIYGHQPGAAAQARLAWAVDARVPAASTGGLPLGLRVYVAADDGAVLGADSLVHQQDATGNVQVWASPGTLPDIPSNPEVLFNGRGLTVSSPLGSAVTDANGDFVIPGVGGSPLDLTFRLEGPLVNVNNQAGPDLQLVQSVTPGVPASIVLNAARTEFSTAEANAWNNVLDFNEFIHATIPGDNTMDFKVKAKVNINASCNAFFNGASINFFRKSGSCNNTSYSTVVAHEEGHWANVKYGSGNGGDGFGEGAADIWAMYIYDNPIVGEFFTTGGGFVRTGNNTRQFCGDFNPACYGEVHADGEVLMGAIWKVRANLNASLGNAAGDLVADTIMLSWFNAFDDGQIRSVVEEHWLALDDDDGSIFNGTPNYAEIDAGFRAQGFPGVDLDVITAFHDELPDTMLPSGPYTVDIGTDAVVGNFVTAATLVYQVGGVNPVSVPMTDLGGGNFTAQIPDVPVASSVQYWVEMTDDLGNTDVGPRAGDRWDFVVGSQTVFFQTFMEAGTTFSHGASSGIDDWQNGQPQGLGGSALGGWSDPERPFAFQAVWGTDLTANGAYSANTVSWLETPPLDASTRQGVHLRFRRWLTVDRSTNDLARILVNGVEKWRNPASAPLIDEDWMQIELDISDVADFNPAVVIRFELQTNGSVNAGGWTLDDLQLVSVLAPGQLFLSGTARIMPGDTAYFSVSSVPTTARLYLLSSAGNGGTTIKGHPFDISRPFVIEGGPVTPNADGTWLFPVTIPPGTPPGIRYMEAAAGGNGNPVSDSNIFELTIQ